MVGRHIFFQLFRTFFSTLAVSIVFAAACSKFLGIDGLIVVGIIVMSGFWAVGHNAAKDEAENLNWILTLPISRMKLWRLNLALNFTRVALMIVTVAFALFTAFAIHTPSKRVKPKDTAAVEKQHEVEETPTIFSVFGKNKVPYFFFIYLVFAGVLTSAAASADHRKKIPWSGKFIEPTLKNAAIAVVLFGLVCLPRTTLFTSVNFILASMTALIAINAYTTNVMKFPKDLARRYQLAANSVAGVTVAIGLFFVQGY